jgi:hypothetical protein
VRLMRCEAGGGRGRVCIESAGVDEQAAMHNRRCRACCLCLSVGLSGALVSWAVLHVELGDGGRAGSTRHTARAHDVPSYCHCKGQTVCRRCRRLGGAGRFCREGLLELGGSGEAASM